MKKIFSISMLLVGCFVNTNAQKGIDELINAEKSFAAYSVNNSTKEAFLKFLDSSGIVFDNGKPVNGIEVWNKRGKRPGVLNWRPQFAEISESGDFGYTSGPWTFQNSLNDSVVARGQYTTVWHMDKNGEWKFLVDLGVTNTPPNSTTDLKKFDVRKGFMHGDPEVSPIVLVEDEFQKLVSKNKSEAYKNYLSTQSIINRNGYLPATTILEQQNLIGLTSTSIKYKIDGSGISPNMDLGYTYGAMTVNGKIENYLRIWRLEKDGWKIALEVLRY